MTSDVLMTALGDNPQKKDHVRWDWYLLPLQLEIADKIKDLTSFQNSLNSHCHKILMKVDYVDISDPKDS